MVETADVWVKSVDSEELAGVTGLQGRWKRFLDASIASQGMVFGMGELAVGEVAGWHDHPEPELFYALEGEALARWRDQDGEHELPLNAGQAFFKESNVPHQMVNVGDGLFRGLFFKLTDMRP